MKYAIISDIHANLDALTRVLKDAVNNGVECVVSLGDAVGYGPLPAETVDLIRERVSLSIAGNHDDAVSGRLGDVEFIDLAGDAVLRHREALSREQVSWLASLPYTADIEGAKIVHGDLVSPQDFNYIENEADASANFEADGFQLLFSGHTHIPGIFLIGSSGTVYKVDPQDFTLEDGKRYIVNPGSVGYPREAHGECHSTYVLYDSVERSIEFRSLPFSVASVMQRGIGPKRLGKKLIASVLIAVAAIAAGLAFLLAPRTTVSDDPALVVSVNTIDITENIQSVRANLKLAKASDPVALRVIFKSPSGDIPGGLSVVKKSNTRAFSVPKGATSVEFSVLKQSTDAKPEIESFQPTALTK